MHRPDPFRWLPALLLIPALPTWAQIPSGQNSGNPQISVPSQSEPAPPPGPAKSVLPASPGDLPSPAAQAPAPTIPLSPEREGDLMQAQKRYQLAIAAYKKVQPPTADVWNKMGIAYQMMFNLKDAMRCYKESIKLDSHIATTMNNLATVYDSMKQYKQAEKMYRKALKIEPTSAVIHKNLGTNLMTQRKYNKGFEEYKVATSLDPQIFSDKNSPRVSNPANVEQRGAMNYYMALGCLHSGQTACALEYLRNALNEGYVTPKKLATDDQFLSLRDNPAFQQMLAEQQKQPQKQ